MIYVKAYNTINGNRRSRSYRVIKSFRTMQELEAERERLREKHGVESIDFAPVVNTGLETPGKEILDDLFN